MNISIICPLYNAEKYIIDLDKNIKMQKNVDIESIKYMLTESIDNTQYILKKINANYDLIKKEDFSHSLTREKAAMKSNGDIIVFITQDIKIKDKFWLYNLVRGIISKNCEAAFSRQICENNSIEKYIREKNYPDKERIVSKKDVSNLGLMAFFFSDASSAIRSDVFKKLNGYDNKDLIINEDMYIAYKLINNGYRIKYCSDSVIIHFHKFTLNQLYKRYCDIGKFFRQNSYLKSYKATSSGLELAKYVLKRSIQEKNIKVLFYLPINFAARFVGMNVGKMKI